LATFAVKSFFTENVDCQPIRFSVFTAFLYIVGQ
jgi:hypothetical protein